MFKNCKVCGKEFKTEDKNQTHCSNTCWYGSMPNKKIDVVCEYCGKPKKIFPSRNDGRHHFCSEKCQAEWQKIFQVKLQATLIQHHKIRLAKVCEYCRRTFKPKRLGAKYCSVLCHLSNLQEIQVGADNPAWRGGTTPYRRGVEGLKEYEKWRDSVYKRDKYRCAICGDRHTPNAHHIKTFSKYPELRTELSNGITLCKDCHKLTHFKESLFEDRFYKTLSLLKDVYKQDVRITFAENNYV